MKINIIFVLSCVGFLVLLGSCNPVERSVDFYINKVDFKYNKYFTVDFTVKNNSNKTICYLSPTHQRGFALWSFVFVDDNGAELSVVRNSYGNYFETRKGSEELAPGEERHYSMDLWDGNWIWPVGNVGKGNIRKIKVVANMPTGSYFYGGIKPIENKISWEGKKETPSFMMNTPLGDFLRFSVMSVEFSGLHDFYDRLPPIIISEYETQPPRTSGRTGSK